MCTVVTRQQSAGPGRALQVLAVRDELSSRAFDPPGQWWPRAPGVVGGRDRLAGGSWCVSSIADGVTALVLNRAERRTGTPSRGLLPLAAVTRGDRWTEKVDHRAMAGFTLVLAGPDAVTAWEWDAETLRRTDLDGGLHIATPRGVDPHDARSRHVVPQVREHAWFDVVTAAEPADDEAALLVRHQVGEDVYASVFAQLITATPGALEIRWSRTPSQAATWTTQTWSAPR